MRAVLRGISPLIWRRLQHGAQLQDFLSRRCPGFHLRSLELIRK